MASYYDYMKRRNREEDAKLTETSTTINVPMTTAKRWIWVTFKREGIHCYPAALEDPALATGDEYDVSFLGYPHRHQFHFRVAIKVTHNDRDIEFIQFQRWLENLYKDDVIQLDHKSCEMMSDDLFNQIVAKYPGRDIKIEISEDGENGALIEYNI
ncbi:hypothetical protein N9I00_00025 [bacterium]|nr:hypothetical protein [bacterium]